MKKILYLLAICVSSSRCIFAQTPDVFFNSIKNLDLTSREEICEQCQTVVGKLKNRAPVQANLTTSLIAVMVENNPKKAVVLSQKAVDLYKERYLSDPDYQKKLSKITAIKELYQKIYENTKKDLEDKLSPEDMIKWENGDLNAQKELIDQEIAKGGLTSIFEDDSLFIKQIKEFDDR